MTPSTPEDIDRLAPAPMYHQLKRRIVDDIASLGLRSGNILPGGHKLTFDQEFRRVACITGPAT